MAHFDCILVVIQRNTDARSLLDKAVTLACSTNDQVSRIHAVKIVYDGLAELSIQDINQSTELKKFILQSEQQELTELTQQTTSSSIDIESSVIWSKTFADGVNSVADHLSANLIIKASDEKIGAFIRTPDDWNLLRESKTPVFLSQTTDWHRSPTIVAAIDALDENHKALSERILLQASSISQILNGTLHICSFYPLFEPWSTRLGVLQSYGKLRKDIEQKTARTITQLARSIGAPRYTFECIEGDPEIGLEQLTEKLGADIVVIGNHARGGLAAAFIGNTAEKILHRTQIDILTIV